LADAGEAVYKINIFDEVIKSRGVVLGVLVVLILMSLICWFIVGYKWLLFARLRRLSARFLDAFWSSGSLDEVAEHAKELEASPLARIFQGGHAELVRFMGVAGDEKAGREGLENVERAVARAAAGEVDRLERRITFLATTGSSAPFIGLFGTVWGIMKAFAYIQPDRPILETVTPHIAQALVATAIGLLAAIPAVMAYNYFVSKIRQFATQMDAFSTDLTNSFRRHFR